MNLKLLQLLVDNRAGGARVPETRITAAADGKPAVIYLYDPIVGDRLTAEWLGYACAQDLVPQIRDITAGEIELRINCPGGDVFAMQAIMNALRNHPAKVTAYVDGVAASAATGIASVCDTVVMEKGALFMIHNSQGMAYGDRNELTAMAGIMEKVDVGMVEAYSARTGADAAQVTAWMDAETWFTAEEAVAAGFADSVNTAADDKRTAKALGRWDLSAFANAPKAEKPPAPAPEPKPEPVPETITAEHRERQQQRLRRSALLAP